jgi:ubiquitin-protein ligase
VTPGMRARRLDNEWQAVTRLAECNPGVVCAVERITREAREIFQLRLCQSAGVSLSPAEKHIAWDHGLQLRFPRFYPAVPLEAYLDNPVFHPNVDPATGFICLWERTSPGDNSLEAVRRVQAILAWKMFNLETVHVMQPEAAEWLATQAEFTLPLGHTTIRTPLEWQMERFVCKAPAASGRRRLSSWEAG